MTELLYLHDSYLKEFGAQVAEASGEGEKQGRFIVLDRTAFYPQGGGQPTDTGKLVRESDGKEFEVVFAKKIEGSVSHEVTERGLQEGDKVRGTIDWEKRYKLMRMHTAAHVLAAVIHEEAGALITGNRLEGERSRFDFSLEDFDRGKFDGYVRKANDKLAGGLEVKTHYLPREEAMKVPGMVKLAARLPPAVKELRIVDIGGYDVQADGGTHVKNTGEVGKMEVLKCENKGKDNRRVYFALKEGE